ncbi:MAG: hypothetical protein RIN56_16490 [Sporomusaceae bacterium]|nr:hypothetical protein [Sporomusaceae bacterium]
MLTGIPVWMVIKGDDLAAGYPNTQQESWLRIVFGNDPMIVNLSKPGNYSGSMVATFEYEIALHKPKYALIHCGTTDAVLGVPNEEFAFNVDALVAMANRQGTEAIICIPPLVKNINIEERLKGYRDILRSCDDVILCDFYEIIDDDDNLSILEFGDELYFDGVYMNAEGHRRLAKIFNEHYAPLFFE